RMITLWRLNLARSMPEVRLMARGRITWNVNKLFIRPPQRKSHSTGTAPFVLRPPQSEIRGRFDDGSFRRRFQFVLDAAPDDSAREGCGQCVVEEERGGQGPQKKVRPNARAQFGVIVFEDERNGAQPEERLPDAEQKDDRDERERPRARKTRCCARHGEREAAEEDRDEEQIRREHDAPEVWRVDARYLQLPRGELKQSAERTV